MSSAINHPRSDISFIHAADVDELIRIRHTSVLTTDRFICVQTASGYRGSSRVDPKGKSFFLSPGCGDEELGSSIREALMESRWVLGTPREGAIYPDGVEFDPLLYDYKLTNDLYAQWIESTRKAYAYKSKRALFTGMRYCGVSIRAQRLVVSPNHHEKLEGWSGISSDGSTDVVISSKSVAAEIGAALRLALSRCT